MPVSATAYLLFGLQGNGFARPSFPPPSRNGVPPFSEQQPMRSSDLREQTVPWRLIRRFYFFPGAYQVTYKVLLEGP